jgi:hypothetical protein
MDADHKQMSTGVELLFTLQLALEIMDEYKLKGLLKNKANMFKMELEKTINDSYDRVYSIDPHMVMTSMNFKHRMISQIASLPEEDAVILSEYVNRFFEDIDKYRKEIIVNIMVQE